MIRNTHTTWGTVARAFHWVTAALVLFLLGHGYWMTHFPAREARLGHYVDHSAFGYLLIALMLARLLWRATNPVPEPPVGAVRWEVMAGRAAHWGLYVLTFAAALTGWALAGTFREPLDSFFGLFSVPSLVTNRALHRALEGTHEVLCWTLAAAVAAHVGAALWHALWKKDEVLQRMLS